MRVLIFYILIFFTEYLHSQSYTMPIQVIYGEDSFELGRLYYSENLKDSIQITSLKFYISDLNFYRNGKKIPSTKKNHLVDLERHETLNFPINFSSNSDSIEFNLGVDSATTMLGQMSGDLDPIYGMYWTWNSGFINFKLEGICPKLKTRKHVFQYHIGGYAYPFNSLQKIKIKSNKGVVMDLKALIEKLDIESNPEIMSPRRESMQVAILTPFMFQF